MIVTSILGEGGGRGKSILVLYLCEKSGKYKRDRQKGSMTLAPFIEKYNWGSKVNKTGAPLLPPSPSDPIPRPFQSALSPTLSQTTLQLEKCQRTMPSRYIKGGH
jgi:hypothetical protein